MVVRGTESSKEEPVEVRNLVTNLVGLVCNSVALLGLIRQKDFSRQFKVHMMSIILVDMQLNIVLLVLTAARARGGLNPAPCVAVLTMALFCLICNAGLMLALAIDRLYAVFAPIHYRIQTKAEVKAGLRVGVAVVSSCPTLLTLLVKGPIPGQYCYPFISTTSHGILLLGLHVAVCGCTTIAIYVSLVCKMKPLCLRSNRLQPQADAGVVMSAMWQKRTRRLTFQSALLVAWFCLSYVPFGFYLIYVASAKGINRTVEIGTTRFVVLTMSPFLNAVMDPFIVLWQVGVFRAISRSVRRCAADLGRHEWPVRALRPPRVIHA